MTKRIILWIKDHPLLYCEKDENDKVWFVINGHWHLDLNGMNGTVVETGQAVTFDKITDAPTGKNYNEVLQKAKEQG